MRASWEAFIQQFGICTRLMRLGHDYLPFVRDFEREMNVCLKNLNINEDFFSDSDPGTLTHINATKKLRSHLRDIEFKQWSELPQKGKGVITFSQVTAANKWIKTRRGLSSSEWVNCIKMLGNVTVVRATPGRSQDGFRCRYNCGEIETLSHVLGSCTRGELLRNNRHNNVRSFLASELKKKWTVHEEVQCHEDNGSLRRVDIIAFDTKTKAGFIIDPTIRWEAGLDQAMQVHNEKSQIYNSVRNDLMTRYDLNNIEVIGLMIGARGTITTFFEDFRKKFNLPTSLREKIVTIVLKGPSSILHNHLYNFNIL